jgi:hypothetical protein
MGILQEEGFVHQGGPFAPGYPVGWCKRQTLSCASLLSLLCIVATLILAVILSHCKKGGSLEILFM